MTGFWFLNDLPRLALERRAIEKLAAEAPWLTKVSWSLGPRFTVEAVLELQGGQFPVRLTYPDQFPELPPAMVPQDFEKRWSRHQYPDGTLCLEWGPDTWHPGITGAQLFESAHRLLATENPGDPAAPRQVSSRHLLTQGQELRRSRGRFLLTPALRGLLESLEYDAPCDADVTFQLQSDSFLLVIQEVRASQRVPWHDTWVPETIRALNDPKSKGNAVLIRTRLPGSAFKSLKEVKDLDTLFGTLGLEPSSLRRERLKFESAGEAALVVDAEGTPHCFVWVWPEDLELMRIAAVHTEELGADSRSPTEFAALKGFRVGIVGVGALGSKIAISLARMGVGAFFLMDEALFLPENIVRHALTLHNVGEHKAQAIAHLIRQSVPSVKVEVSLLNLTGQESNTEVATGVQKLSSSDLVIDATADPKVFNILATASASKKVPMLWAQVLAGGVGGLVARSRPISDPPPRLVRDAYHQYTRDNPYEDLPSGVDYGLTTTGGETVVADDAQVSTIAAYAAQLAIDTLLKREPSRFPGSLYLIGMQRAWVFEEPFHTILIPTNGLTPPTKQANPQAEKLEEEAIAFVVELLEKKGAPPPAK